MPLLRDAHTRHMDMREFPRRDLTFIALVMGFSSGIIQVLLIREILALCRGNELIIGILFASWFLGIYLGARIKSTAERAALTRRMSFSLLLLPIMAMVSV